MFASQISHRLFSYDNYRENNTIRKSLDFLLPACRFYSNYDGQPFYYLWYIDTKTEMHCYEWRNKNKTHKKKKLWNSEIVYFSWSSMLFIFFLKNQSLHSNLKSETCQTCNTSQRKCHGIINNTWFQGKAISPEENRPGSKDSNWQKINKILEDFNSLK